MGEYRKINMIRVVPRITNSQQYARPIAVAWYTDCMHAMPTRPHGQQRKHSESTNRTAVAHAAPPACTYSHKYFQAERTGRMSDNCDYLVTKTQPQKQCSRDGHSPPCCVRCDAVQYLLHTLWHGFTLFIYSKVRAGPRPLPTVHHACMRAPSSNTWARPPPHDLHRGRIKAKPSPALKRLKPKKHPRITKASRRHMQILFSTTKRGIQAGTHPARAPRPTQGIPGVVRAPSPRCLSCAPPCWRARRDAPHSQPVTARAARVARSPLAAHARPYLSVRVMCR
jgi:hypothetical protein